MSAIRRPVLALFLFALAVDAAVIYLVWRIV